MRGCTRPKGGGGSPCVTSQLEDKDGRSDLRLWPELDGVAPVCSLPYYVSMSMLAPHTGHFFSLLYNLAFQ